MRKRNLVAVLLALLAGVLTAAAVMPAFLPGPGPSLYRFSVGVNGEPCQGSQPVSTWAGRIATEDSTIFESQGCGIQLWTVVSQNIHVSFDNLSSWVNLDFKILQEGQICVIGTVSPGQRGFGSC